jgi:phosphate-selective porin OprO and OprP
MEPFRIIIVATALAIASTATLRAEPADKAEVDALRAQVQQLQEQLKALAQKLDAKENAAAAATDWPASAPEPSAAVANVSPAGSAALAAGKVVINDKGVTLSSADGADLLKFHGLVQLDSRIFFADQGASTNGFVLRRARVSSEGTFAKRYSYVVLPEWGGSSLTLLDANFSVALSPSLQVKFGKFKPTTGLERLQSDSVTFFDERSIVTNLAPDRDLGIQVAGDLYGGKLTYAASIVNGEPDATSTNNSDFDNDKEIISRVFAMPFKGSAGSALQGLSFGVAGTLGRAKTAAGRTAGYKTDGQQTFFAYNGAVIADGQQWRVLPQLDYRNGPFGLLGEYTVSAVTLRSSAGAPKTELRNRAWQIAAGYVLTGEDSSYNGVAPRTDFDLSAGTWGAFEVAARYADLSIDDDAFPTFASPATAADEAKSVGLGLNWYLSKTVRFTFDYYQTRFGFNLLAPAVSAAPLLRQDEKAFISRFQLSF